MTATRTPPAAGRALVAVLALVLGACTGGGADELTLADTPEEAAAANAVADEPESCRVEAPAAEPVVAITGPDPVALSATVAARTHRCAEVAVVAPADDAWLATVATAVALAEDAPLLLVPPTAPGALAAELERLDPDDVLAIGVASDALHPDAATIGPVPPPPPAAPDADPAAPGADPRDPGTDPAAPDADPDAPDADATASDADPSAAGREAPATEPTQGAEPDEAAADSAGSPPAATDGAATPVPALPLETMIALAVIEHLGAEAVVAVPIDDVEARAAAGLHLQPGDAILPLPTDPQGRAAALSPLDESVVITVLATDPATADALTAELTAIGREMTTPSEIWPTATGDTAWLVDPAQGPATATAVVAAAGLGQTVVPVDLADLRRGRDRTARLRGVAPDQVVVVGDATPHLDWQLPTVLEGPPLPGGGFSLFEDERMVALYGHPQTSALGVLGEQDLDGAVERARQVAAPYGADGVRVLPAFEIIATVASAEAGQLGDYSRRTPVELLRPYVDRAAEEGIYVILDLQSGRTDFLTQAKEYEELLLQPHVGLALDPEWRLEPTEVHLRQIGSVKAAEVQQVADWLAELTREHQLPQKLLVLHQFRLDMLPERDTVVAPPELAVVVHMDGQGPIGSKDGTYRTITQGVEDRWLWGWKNFYDEDIPTPTPDHVLALDPLPVFVTYQ